MQLNKSAEYRDDDDDEGPESTATRFMIAIIIIITRQCASSDSGMNLNSGSRYKMRCNSIQLQ